MTATILIVDDEDDIRKLVGGLLADEGYKTVEAPDKLQALAFFEDDVTPPDAVLLDIWLEGGTREGLEILAALKSRPVSPPVIMMSGHGTLETAVEAIKTGAYDFLEKPFKTDRLMIMLQRALEQASLQRRLNKLERSDAAGEIVAKSKAMQDLIAEIERLAPTKSRVLISGEAGSGKSVIARLIHEKSERSGACITVNGGSFSESALEEAKDGTLILEQPEDMPQAAQALLTRLLQEQSEVRVITITRANLLDLVKQGKFREDLYYRLNVVPLTAPSLRERKADIPDLVAALLPRLAKDSEISAPSLSPAQMTWLQAQDWPGNVRELRNTLERFLILKKPLEDEGQSETNTGESGWGDLLGLPLKDARERFEHGYLEAQLLRHDRNITATADFVGMDRAALHRKLKGLGILGSEK